MCMCPKSHVPFDYFTLGYDVSPTVPCALCGRNVSANEATAGSVRSNGEQVFACNVHTLNRLKWVKAWAIFEIEQQRKREMIDTISTSPTESVRYLERRLIKNASQQAIDVAHHLHVRQALGSAVIFVERPQVFLSVLRRRWINISRNLLRERASTIDSDYIRELDRQFSRMKSLRFVTQSPKVDSNADIYVLHPNDFELLPDGCKTAYVCAPLEDSTCSHLMDCMQPPSVMVEYMTTESAR